jgi:ethanolamine utilization protein EutM
LVETRGLIGAIEAADAMLKAANVKLIGKEKTNPGLITIQIVGETAAVKSAVAAGAIAAARVGELVSTLVIPRPDLQLEFIIPGLCSGEETTEEIFSETPILSEIQIDEPEAIQPEIEIEIPEAIQPEVKVELPETVEVMELFESEPTVVVSEERLIAVSTGLEDKRVTDLRTLARKTENFPIKGREISNANKEELLKLFASLSKPVK